MKNTQEKIYIQTKSVVDSSSVQCFISTKNVDKTIELLKTLTTINLVVNGDIQSAKIYGSYFVEKLTNLQIEAFKLGDIYPNLKVIFYLKPHIKVIL